MKRHPSSPPHHNKDDRVAPPDRAKNKNNTNQPEKYKGHHSSNRPTSGHRYEPYNRERERDRGDRHDSTYRSDYRRYDRKPYDRNNRGGNYRGNNNRGRPRGGGGYRGNNRGGYRSNRGHRTNRGGGRGGGSRAPTGKYDFLAALNPKLLASIKQLSLDKRGAQPLRKWIDKINNCEYYEARFKPGKAKKVVTGKQGNESVFIGDIPLSAQVKIERNSDKWLNDLPATNNKMILTFPNRVAVTTNSIRIDDKSLTVHQYTFNIQGKSTEEKEEKLHEMDMDADERRDIYMKFRRHLRAFNPHTFDNLHIFSFNKDPPKEPVFTVENDIYKVTLERQQTTDVSLQCSNNNNSKNANAKCGKSSFLNIYKSCGIYFQQMGMSILNRGRFRSANYAQLHYREDAFYSLQDLNAMEVWTQNGTDLQFPDLRLLKGYKSSILPIQTSFLIKNQLSRKLITKHSLYDLIRANGIEAVDKWIKGKRAITSYSDQIVEIDGLDKSLNLDSTFPKNNCQISYRQYYTDKKDSRTNRKVTLLEQQEQCLVIHHVYTGRGRDKKVVRTLHFLPQLLYVIVSIDEHNQNTKQELRKRSHPSLQLIISKSLEINKILAQKARTRNSIFSTDDRPIQVRGFLIDAPFICFKSNHKIGKQAAESFTGRVWKGVDDFWYNLRSIYGAKVAKHNNQRAPARNGINWVICYDSNGGNGDQFAREVQKFFHQFNSNQGFRTPPLNQPKIIAMDYNDLRGIRDALRRSAFTVAVFILGQQPIYRKYKVDITRYVLFESPAEFDRKSTDRKANNLRMDLQFIHEATIRKRAAVFNVFNTLLLKSRVLLYYIEPRLPSNVFNYRRLWMIGIKILRKGKGGGANLLVLSCNRAPFVGSIAYITNHSVMIAAGQDVIPQHIMKQVTMEMLKVNLHKIVSSKGDEQLPLNIIILRCSGSDGLLKTIISKEIAGFKQSLYDFCKLKKEKKLIRKMQKRWHPGCIFSVLQENVPDAFGVGNNDNVMYSQRALVVSEGITSAQYFDVFLSLPTKQERQFYGRVMRIITLMDDYNSGTAADGWPDIKLSTSAKHLSDYISLIYSSIWGYALNIPFPKVPNYPSPIKFAEHYASWQYSLLTDHDTSLTQLNIDIDNAKPKICNVIAQNNCNENVNDDNSMSL